MATSTLAEPIVRIRFRNPTDSDMDLWIEPLGEHVTIPQRTTIEMHCTEQLGYPNEFELTKDGLTVHGWVQTVYVVSKNGELHSLWGLPEDC